MKNVTVNHKQNSKHAHGLSLGDQLFPYGQEVTVKEDVAKKLEERRASLEEQGYEVEISDAGSVGSSSDDEDNGEPGGSHKPPKPDPAGTTASRSR